MNYPQDHWHKAILSPNATIGDAILNLEQVAIKIVLIVNQEESLLGTVSDGDIRRGLLKGLDLKSPIGSVINYSPLVVPTGLSREMINQFMHANKVQHIPVVDQQNHVVGLHLLNEISVSFKRKNLMVIMAGGKGVRLLPHTENCPKPLLSVAGKPMLEHIINRAKLEGFNRFVITINYLGYMIEDYFGNGENLDVEIDYLRETNPLGTAGALSLLNPVPDASIIVTNGDLLSKIRYGELLDFHIQHAAIATMAIRVHEWQHPFGVVETSGVEIVGFEEKPIARSNINAGVYVLEPHALSFLNNNAYYDMPNLFESLRVNKERIVAYPMHEQWLDVGRPDDLKAGNII